MVGKRVVGKRRRVEHAVHMAEATTGLQVTVYLGPAGEDSRARAEEMFVAAELNTRPAVLLLVSPSEHKVEIVTAASVRHRISDDDCARAIAEMLVHFREGRIAEGIEVGLSALATAAGPKGTGDASEELPNVVTDPEFRFE